MNDAKNDAKPSGSGADKKRSERAADQAPELHNDEQDATGSQAQDVAQEALQRTPGEGLPTESVKPRYSSDLVDDSAQDLVDHMRDMESSGLIDMDAYRGEPNHDDDDDKYGKGHDLDEDEEADEPRVEGS